jgi:hypothetical protein
MIVLLGKVQRVGNGFLGKIEDFILSKGLI